MKKTYIFVAIGIIGVTSLLSALYIKNQEESPNMPAINGTVACLPLKGAESSKEGTCTLGLKNKAGLYLALQGVSQDDLKAGDSINVEGALTPPTENDTHMTAGTIAVVKHTK